MEKNMFFVIPEMPSKTFVMVLKKILITLSQHAPGGVQGVVRNLVDVEDEDVPLRHIRVHLLSAQ